MFHRFSVGGYVLKVSRDQKLKKDHGVDQRVTGIAVEFFRILVKETQVERFAEPSVEVFLWDPVRQLEADEQFFGIVLFALHTFNIRISAHWQKQKSIFIGVLQQPRSFYGTAENWEKRRLSQKKNGRQENIHQFL